MNKRLKIVITGANGFVATNVRKYFSEKNIELISISRNDFKEFKNEQKIISKNYDEKTILPIIKNSYALI
ncbi:MAG TPA: epimerase, partial [Nitrosopumilus sp.]|nr:epimerase [Nitrosopumilus sp.]